MKRFVPALAGLALLVGLALEAEETAWAVRDGLALCAESVIPALFPFLVASGLFISLGGAERLGQLFAPLLRPLGCAGAGGGALLLGLIGGYPVGGRSVGELYRQGLCTQAEGQRLLLFCNNCGPAFILGVAGLGCFGSLRAGLWLYLIHVLSALLLALLLPPAPAAEVPILPRQTPALLSAFLQAVQAALESMLRLCAFVLFFLVLLRLLTKLTGLHHPALLGLAELTQGILRLENTRESFCWAAFLLSWGGLSVHCQTAAVLEGTPLRLGPYLLAKTAQAALSAAMAWPVSLYLWA